MIDSTRRGAALTDLRTTSREEEESGRPNECGGGDGAQEQKANIYLVAVGGQLVKVVLYFRAYGLRGKEEDLLVLDRVQDLVRNVPGVR